MTWEEIHPAINAVFNATSFVLLISGFVAIKGGKRERHRKLMIAALTVSAIFLVSYLIRFAISGTHRYPGDGWDKTLYLLILGSHSVLAASLLVLVPRTMLLALKGRYAEHKKWAKRTWPIWIYVSITGVVVYLMLYPIAAAVHGGG